MKNTSGLITLNVGGWLFTTLKLKLQILPFLSAIISGKHTTLKDESGNIFIDRDPDLFDQILLYLRSDVLKPTLFDELEYYGLDDDKARRRMGEKYYDELIEKEKYYDE